jgi:lipopolysaccharide export LptBFGC system permease protein LptF
MASMSQPDDPAARAKAIAEAKKDVVLYVAAVIVVVVMARLGGSGVVSALRWVVAVLALVLAVAAWAVGRRRARVRAASSADPEP